MEISGGITNLTADLFQNNHHFRRDEVRYVLWMRTLNSPVRVHVVRRVLDPGISIPTVCLRAFRYPYSSAFAIGRWTLPQIDGN